MNHTITVMQDDEQAEITVAELATWDHERLHALANDSHGDYELVCTIDRIIYGDLVTCEVLIDGVWEDEIDTLAPFSLCADGRTAQRIAEDVLATHNEDVHTVDGARVVSSSGLVLAETA